MKIQLIGFNDLFNPNYKLDIFKEIVENTDADLILFPGHTFRDEDDLFYEEIDNRHSIIVTELENANPTSCMFTSNELFVFKDGLPYDLFSCQLFATADDINYGGKELMHKFFDEISRRRLTCCGKSIVILQCGETSLLVSSKANNYKAEFRFKDDPELNKRYEELLSTTDIFLNPIHTVQGEQGIMKQRRITLSSDGRYYFSTASLPEDMAGKLNSKRLQYIYHNGEEITVKPVFDKVENYVSRTFEI